MRRRQGLSFMDIQEMGAMRRMRAKFNAWLSKRARMKRIKELAKPGMKISDIIGMGVI